MLFKNQVLCCNPKLFLKYNSIKMKKQNLVEKPKRIYGKRTDYGERTLSKELGKRYVDYRKKWIKASNRELVTEFPLYIQIEHTGKCNLKCPTCLQGIKSLRDNYSRGFKPLSMNLYEKVLNEAREYHCPSMSFHNNDEPLLLNDLEERIKMAKKAGFIDLIITTNANLLNRERTDKLLKSGVTKINFSVDAFNEKDYEKIRIGGNFKNVIRNIDYFVKRRDDLGLKLPITRATCVLTRFTAPKTKGFFNFWSKKVDMVEFQNYQAIKNYTEKNIPAKAKIYTGFTCNFSWQQIVIRANGDVLPCCSFYATGMVVGNIKDSSIYNIWNGSQMKKIREELLKNNFRFSPACEKCAGTFYVTESL